MADEPAAPVPDPSEQAAPTPPPSADAGAPAAGLPADTAGIDTQASTAQAAPDAASAELETADQAAIDELLKQASFEDPTAVVGSSSSDSDPNLSGVLPSTEAFDLPNFQQVMADAQVSSIDLLRDVELNVKIELGRSRMLVEDVLKLAEGSVVELDKLAGDPVDVFVNDRLVARGEVLVLNENFCVRVNEIVANVKDESF